MSDLKTMTRVDWETLQASRKKPQSYALALFEGIDRWTFPVALDERLASNRATAELVAVWDEIRDIAKEPERRAADEMLEVLAQRCGGKPPTDDPALTAFDPHVLRTLLAPSTVQRMAATAAAFPFAKLAVPFSVRCLGVPHHRAWIDQYSDFQAPIEAFARILAQTARHGQGLIVASA